MLAKIQFKWPCTPKNSIEIDEMGINCQPVLKPAKVCHISSVHFALDTRLFYRFCQSLSQHYQVTLIAVHPKKEIRNGITIIPFHRFKNKVFRVSFTWLIMFIKALRVRAELYQLHDPELIPCGLLLRLVGKKVILDIHENVAEDIFDKPWIKNKKLLFNFFRLFESLAVKYFYVFLAEESYEKRYKQLGAKYEIVLNYFDPKFFEPFIHTHRTGSMRIFYIGILLKSRGILEIAEAIYILKQRNITIHFDVVGELYSGLDVEIDSLPFIHEIKSQLHFHGRLSLEDGYEISKQAAIGMCIIHPMKNSVGSYPTKMFEYMAIGLPQVTSAFPLYQSVVETHHCGYCVNPLDPIAIADAIEKIFILPELANKMSIAGLTASKSYTWDTQFRKALAVYQNLLK